MLIGLFAFANNLAPSRLNGTKTLLYNQSMIYAQSIDNKIDELGRQTCSKTVYMADGSSITISASAGWFLSNNAAAMSRACQKVNEAMGIYE